MKVILDSIELQVLRRAGYLRQCNLPRESQGNVSINKWEWELGGNIVDCPKRQENFGFLAFSVGYKNGTLV